jgi:malate/lactate dehydrogenase
LQVVGYPADKLDEALQGVKVVVIPAGVPRKVRLSSLCIVHVADVRAAWHEP